MNSRAFWRVYAGRYTLGLILISSVVTLVACGDSSVSDGGKPAGIVIMRSDCGGFEVEKRFGWVPTDKTCLRWDYNNERTLLLFHLNAGMNCCTHLVATVDFDDYKITIREDESGQYCFCQCLYDIEYSITDLPPARYTIVVEEKYLPEGDDSLSVTIDLAEKPSGQVCVDRTRSPWEPPEVGMNSLEGRLIVGVVEKNSRHNSAHESH